MKRDISFNIGFFDKTMSNFDCQLPFEKKLFLKGCFAFTDVRNMQGNDKISGVLAYLRHNEPHFLL